MFYNSPFPISIGLQAPYQSNSWYPFFHMKKKRAKKKRFIQTQINKTHVCMDSCAPSLALIKIDLTIHSPSNSKTDY